MKGGGGAIEKFKLVSESSCAFIKFWYCWASSFDNRHGLRGF